MPEYGLPLIFFFIAFFYASVGFGGGSSYLALLSLFLTEFQEIRTLALLLNLIVVSIGTFMFIQNDIFKWKLFWPFILSSVPLSFLGAQLQLSEKIFFLVLGSALLGASFFIFIQLLQRSHSEKTLRTYKKLTIGSGIGLLSGISGIGGGIFLSPTLNLISWKDGRTVAALASIFILFNSVAGLGGLIASNAFKLNMPFAFPLILAVAVGGTLGSFTTNKKLNVQTIKVFTAVLIAYVGLRIVLLHGWGLHI